MSSTYPGARDTFHTPINQPGTALDDTHPTSIFSEHFSERSDAIIAIEETLGANPQGEFETVAARLDAGGGGGVGNLDGGVPSSTYGGTTAIDGGGA